MKIFLTEIPADIGIKSSVVMAFVIPSLTPNKSFVFNKNKN